MACVLYITCNIRTQSESRSLTLGQQFLEEYLQQNPQDEVEALDLYRDSIQRVDQDVLKAVELLEKGEGYSSLSYEERRKLGRIWRLSEQFCRCDKYVFITHSLNLWFPAEFKIYIDAISLPNRTYCLTSCGATGMLSAAHRKSLHLHANKPYSFGREQDMSAAYLRSILNFFGVTTQQTLLLHGDDPKQRDPAEDNLVQRTLLAAAHQF